MRLPELLCITFLVCSSQLSAQSTYHQMAGDTIIAHHSFLNSSYLLDGKKLNPSVMQWFMSDFEEAYEYIRISNISEQVSIGSYTIGSIFIVAGVLSASRNPRISKELRLWGVLGLGGGIVFQVFSGRYRRRAVEYYNDQIRSIYDQDPRPVSIQFRLESGAVKSVLSF
jgi:hypothetical protein